jgi:cation diffusion facilitator CzcD-associated flavoprotein CzcO
VSIGSGVSGARGPVSDRGETVCVIGAGAAGLTAVKNLTEHGFGVDCYERETTVGGAWNWRHDRSPVYASTHLISSKPFTQFPDFPMPDDWPDYPHHSQALEYLERYADHFGVRDQVWFGTEVVRIHPADGDRWYVTTRSTGGGDERTTRYAAVVVANGHNWAPKLPTYERLDQFRGAMIHASQYKDAAQLRGHRVLVVGAGNTGCDIAVEAAQQAAACWHSTRRGYWYAPKYVMGRPVDQVNDAVLALRVPLRLRQWIFHRTLRLTVGDLTRFGLPKPDHGCTRPIRSPTASWCTTSATAASCRCRTWPGSPGTVPS